MVLWSDIRKIRRESDNDSSHIINLGRASEYIYSFEAGKLAKVYVEEDRVTIMLLEYDEPNLDNE